MQLSEKAYRPPLPSTTEDHLFQKLKLKKSLQILLS